MSVLIVELEVSPGAEDDLERAFVNNFRPAISALLRPPGGQRWLLEVRFVDEAKRLAWVATDIHRKVWPEIERLCGQFKSDLFQAVR